MKMVVSQKYTGLLSQPQAIPSTQTLSTQNKLNARTDARNEPIDP